MSRIHIGEQWVEVPDGYIAAENIFCKEETDLFYETVANNIDDTELYAYRELVLEKRIEFYTLWIRGKVPINDY